MLFNGFKKLSLRLNNLPRSSVSEGASSGLCYLCSCVNFPGLNVAEQCWPVQRCQIMDGLRVCTVPCGDWPVMSVRNVASADKGLNFKFYLISVKFK